MRLKRLSKPRTQSKTNLISSFDPTSTNQALSLIFSKTSPPKAKKELTNLLIKLNKDQLNNLSKIILEKIKKGKKINAELYQIFESYKLTQNSFGNLFEKLNQNLSYPDIEKFKKGING